MFAFCKLLFCHDSLENVASIDAFKVVPLPAAKQKIFRLIIFFKICPLFMLSANFWAFWWKLSDSSILELSGWCALQIYLITYFYCKWLQSDGALDFVEFFWTTLYRCVCTEHWRSHQVGWCLSLKFVTAHPASLHCLNRTCTSQGLANDRGNFWCYLSSVGD